MKEKFLAVLNKCTINVTNKGISIRIDDDQIIFYRKSYMVIDYMLLDRYVTGGECTLPATQSFFANALKGFVKDTFTIYGKNCNVQKSYNGKIKVYNPLPVLLK